MVCDQETPSEVSEPSWIPWSSDRQLQGSGPSKWQLKLQKALLLSLKDFSGVEIRSLIQGYLQRMWSGLNLTMLGVVPPHTDLQATGHALAMRLDSCTTVHQGLQRRLTCCLQLAAEGSHTTQESARATWQRDPDFWDFCLFFWVFHRSQLNVITFQDITWLTLLLSFYLWAWLLNFEGMGTQEPRVLDAVVF